MAGQFGRRLRFEGLEDRSLLSVTALDDVASASEITAVDRIGQSLQLLASATSRGLDFEQGIGADGNGFRPASLQIDDNRVAIHAAVMGGSSIASLTADLEAIGFQKAMTNGSVVSGWLPVASISMLSTLSSLHFARPIAAPATSVGSTTTGGHDAQRTDVIGSRTRWLMVLGVRIAVLLIGMVCASQVVLEAAPATFRLDATVASPLQGTGNSNLPFSVSPGDPIVASISFDPEGNGPLFPQTGNMRFEIGETVLEVSGFQIIVENDEGLWIDLSGRVAEPDNTPDIDGERIGDDIIVSCAADQSMFCGVVPGRNFGFQPLLVFSDPESLLTSNHLPADPNTWESFAFREMALIFNNASTGSGTYIGAYIGEIQPSPEPSTISLLALFCVLGVRARSRNS